MRSTTSTAEPRPEPALKGVTLKEYVETAIAKAVDTEKGAKWWLGSPHRPTSCTDWPERRPPAGPRRRARRASPEARVGRAVYRKKGTETRRLFKMFGL